MLRLRTAVTKFGLSSGAWSPASLQCGRVQFLSSVAAATNSEELPLPSNLDSPHNSLATFISHASRTNLQKQTTLFKGTYYEYLCLESLKHLGFSVTRTGGRDDAGIDLLGTWELPSQPSPLRCVVQCKGSVRKIGPNIVRELEGAFSGAPVEWRGENTVGVLCSTKPATKGVRDAIRNSQRGLVWVLVEGRGGNEGLLKQAIWNQRVVELGAQGVGVGLVYPPSVQAADADEREDKADEVVRLTWEGKIWTPS